MSLLRYQNQDIYQFVQNLNCIEKVVSTQLLKHGSVFKLIFERKGKWYVFSQGEEGLKMNKLTNNGCWTYFNELFRTQQIYIA